jgi:hypothetical protein
MSYRYWGSEPATCRAEDAEYPDITGPDSMYEALSHVWCAETCAPRMRADWTQDNMTLGQCSVTSFLAQDIFGGEVLGVLLEDGNWHCFNRVGDLMFDLTSEQFPEGELDYSVYSEQSRETHFAKEEKRQRYELLKEKLRDYCRNSRS